VSQVPSFALGFTSPIELHNQFIQDNKDIFPVQPQSPKLAQPVLTLVEAINKANQVAIANAINDTQEEIDAESWGSVDSKQDKVRS
jgi:hypothetical protein